MKLKKDYSEKEREIISELENHAKIINDIIDYADNIPSDVDPDILVYSKYLRDRIKNECNFPYKNQ